MLASLSFLKQVEQNSIQLHKSHNTSANKTNTEGYFFFYVCAAKINNHKIMEHLHTQE